MRFILDGLEVFFPYDYVYREQYQYMLELKRALDAKGHGILEMPTGTGKTVSLLSLITSYQAAHPDTVGKLIYCTRTVPEMSKTVEELKRVMEYRTRELTRLGRPPPADMLAVCLSSRRNLCVHPSLANESDKEKVDAGCRSMTASWVRAKAEAAKGGSGPGSGSEAPLTLCDFFEGWDANGTDAEIKGIYTLDDLKALGVAKGWCPYFTARHVISYANVVVYNYQYMLDPKIASLVSKELDDRSIVVSGWVRSRMCSVCHGGSHMSCDGSYNTSSFDAMSSLSVPSFYATAQVFDEAHNIDNVCIEALSVTLDRRLLDGAAANLSRLSNEVKAMKQADAARLQDEYNRLVAGLGVGGALGDRNAAAGGAGAGAGSGSGNSNNSSAAAVIGANGLRGGEEDLLSASAAAPLLPASVLAEAVPGNIRNAELFVRFMKHIVSWLRDKIKVAAVVSETPVQFLSALSSKLGVDPRPLRFAYSRLSSLLRTLQVTGIDEFGPLTVVADFTTLLATYPQGFMVISEPYTSKTPHVPDPVMQLTCLDASLAVKPVFERFTSVILTSGTLSPLDMYPKMLAFNPVVRVSLEMSILRPCICPLIVSRGSDQTPLTTKFENRDDPSVLRNYGALLLHTCATVPDGVVAFFPSYSYMESVVTSWAASGLLSQLEAHKVLFIETKDVVETSLALTNYKTACDIGRGALFLSVARGKVAEGIDFDRHYGRAVIVIGIPFQYTLSHVLRARLQYLNDRYGIREQDFLTFDAIRHASQCVGRVIRSKRDYGIIIFADKRYGSADKKSKLPSWVLQFLPDAHTGLTTDMAAHISRKFLKEQAQPLPPGMAERERGTTFLTSEDIEDMNASGVRGGALAGGGGGGMQPQPSPVSAAVAAAVASSSAVTVRGLSVSGGGSSMVSGLAGFAEAALEHQAAAAAAPSIASSSSSTASRARMAGSGFLVNVGGVAGPLAALPQATMEGASVGASHAGGAAAAASNSATVAEPIARPGQKRGREDEG